MARYDYLMDRFLLIAIAVIYFEKLPTFTEYQ
jgi:hypothetical protein